MNALKTALAIPLLLLLAFTPISLSASPQTADQAQGDRIYARRLALLVGANNGGRDRAVLRFAVDDARALGKVLEEMGGVLPGDARYLENPGRAALLAALKELGAESSKAGRTARRVEVIFYFSGHSDEEALFLGEEHVSYVEIKDLVTSLEADVRIAIFDSCASGALTLPKGIIKRSPFLLDTAYDMKGYAFVTSSAAGEAAQESERLGRSFFTHNLISGMRGAADMNLDGRVTLNEAYQFAFDGTLTQTERTMAGAQHPSRHVQMSGTGDVVITEIRKSAAVLVFEPVFAGRVFVHGEDGFLLVELNKAAGREVAIGLEPGAYRIFAVDPAGGMQKRVNLDKGESLELARGDFSKANRLPAVARGSVPPPTPVRLRWSLELTGGLGAIDPADLNMRGTYDRMSSSFYGNDYLAYLVSKGEIASFVRTSDGGDFRPLNRSAPFGVRLRRRLARWLDLSVGFTHFSDRRTSSFADQYAVTELDGGTKIYTDRLDDYTVAVGGYLPTVGVHFGGNISRSVRLEASVSGGPLFADCLYTFQFHSDLPNPVDGTDALQDGVLEERGVGVGPAFNFAARLEHALGRRTGVFFEGGYTMQTVSGISGPGTRSLTGSRDAWEGEWAMKQMVAVEPWGTGRFLWPSNGWELFGGDWWRARDFKLQLSGFQAKFGFFFRF